MDDLLTSYSSLMLATMKVTINKLKDGQQHGASFRKGTMKVTMNTGKQKDEQQHGASFRKGTPVRRGSRKY